MCSQESSSSERWRNWVDGQNKHIHESVKTTSAAAMNANNNIHDTTDMKQVIPCSQAKLFLHNNLFRNNKTQAP